MALLLCFIPLVLVMLICTFGFKLKVTHQLLACLFGLVAVLPISVIQYFIPVQPLFIRSPVTYSLLKSLLVYGLVEEAIKMGLIWPLPHKKYDSLSFLMLSFVLGIALGSFESVVYYLDHLQMANAKGAQLILGQIFARIFTSDLIHMLCTGLSGLFVYSCRQKKAKVICLIYAIVFHGLYDFFAGFHTNLKWFSIVVILLTIAECRIKYTSLQNDAE